MNGINKLFLVLNTVFATLNGVAVILGQGDLFTVLCLTLNVVAVVVLLRNG